MKSKTFTASEILSFSLIVDPVNQNCGFDNLKLSLYDQNKFSTKTNKVTKTNTGECQGVRNVKMINKS